ncbi:MAG: oligopeptide transporter, OPT family, partial [Gemmatimonadota bacterium]
LVLGVVLSVILGAANAYLGLFAGMTVSASIPAAVISMGILSLFRNSNILENNIVQTAASAGESLAAGVIFTIPALVLMGYWHEFDYLEIARISGLGGLIGVLFTIPLRRALIIEAGLKYPEGVATAEVLRTGEAARTHAGAGEGRAGLLLLVRATLAGGLMKLCHQGFGMWEAAIEGATAIRGAVFGMGFDLSPALVAVGYIVGRNIAILVFAGGVISWLVAMPLYSGLAGGFGDANLDTAYGIWNGRIRYLGVGAMVVGGIWSILKLMKPLAAGIRSSLESHRQIRAGVAVERTELDIPIRWVVTGLALSMLPLLALCADVLESWPTALLMALVMLVFGFLFSAVAGYMAGLVGSSNNPVSGVTIATILFTSLLLLAIKGAGSLEGAAGAIIIGAVICCAAAISGDTLQDLKAGHIVGATPWKQQVMEVVGVVASAFALGLTLDILHTAYTIGSPTLSAPQATLMKAVAEGVFHGNLPWDWVAAGALLGGCIIGLDQIQQFRGASFRIPILAVAVGIYLPVSLSASIFVGGMVAHWASRAGAADEGKRGLLFASGLITGEALLGILVAVPIFATANKNWWPTFEGFWWLGGVLFVGVVLWMYRVARDEG